MRHLYLSLFFVFCCFVSYAQKIHEGTVNALEYISQGYIQYGYGEIKKCAIENGVGAQFYLAVCYENGIVENKNLTEAFKLYKRAAERGLPDAMIYLARFYKNGIVVSKNDVTYKEWVKRYQKKGGQCVLPDFISIYNEGLKHVENYAMNPKPNNGNSMGGQMTVNSNNTSNSHNNIVNNITVVQQVAPSQPVVTQPISQPTPQPKDEHKVVEVEKSDVDENIPIVSNENENTFALIIANENYQNVASVPNAINDGKVFAEYCEKALGLPKLNIHFVKDATYNNIKRELNLVAQIAQAYNTAARFIIYYAGHGLPDEDTKNAYLLPVDGYGSDLTTCYSLGDLYKTLGNMPASQVVVLLDACFSGSQRGGGMLASARGVAIKAKKGLPTGNMVVLSAAQGEETAYPYKEKRHGLFTYYLLKKLQTSKGEVCMGDLFDYVKDNVVKKSLVVNGKQQTPSASFSTSVSGDWRSWTLQ